MVSFFLSSQVAMAVLSHPVLSTHERHFRKMGEDPRFVMDFSLFRVARQLRLLGFDAACEEPWRHVHLQQIARSEGRIIVTASRKFAKSIERSQRLALQEYPNEKYAVGELTSKLPCGNKTLVGYNSEGESEYEFEPEETAPLQYILVDPSANFKAQAEKIIRTLGLAWDPNKIFSRCVQCNGTIFAEDKATVEGDVHPTVFRLYSNFYRCAGCRRVYWGMDEGVVLNYKSLRTVEHARALCERALAPSSRVTSPTHEVPVCHKNWGSAPLGGLSPSLSLRVHLFAYPRNIKCLIISFLSSSDHELLVKAFPMFVELVGVVQRGESWTFKPIRRRQKGPSVVQ